MLLYQLSVWLQIVPEEHNLIAFDGARYILTSTCVTISEFVCKYIRIYFCYKLVIWVTYYTVFCTYIQLARHKRGSLHFLWEFMSFYLDCGLSVAQMQLTWFYTSKSHLLQCWIAHKMPSSCQPGFHWFRELLDEVFATWHEWNSSGYCCRHQREKYSCGVLVKGMAILVKYWLCFCASSLSVQTDYVSWLHVLRKWG